MLTAGEESRADVGDRADDTLADDLDPRAHLDGLILRHPDVLKYHRGRIRAWQGRDTNMEINITPQVLKP